jgi:hypothetical protein
MSKNREIMFKQYWYFNLDSTECNALHGSNNNLTCIEPVIIHGLLKCMNMHICSNVWTCTYGRWSEVL